jgi:hypothetical protein
MTPSINIKISKIMIYQIKITQIPIRECKDNYSVHKYKKCKNNTNTHKRMTKLIIQQ